MVKILYFAGAARATGTSSEEWEAAPLDLEGLWRSLIEKHPALDALRSACMVAVNHELVRDGETVIRDGDEVAVMTAFSGG